MRLNRYVLHNINIWHSLHKLVTILSVCSCRILWQHWYRVFFRDIERLSQYCVICCVIFWQYCDFSQCSTCINIATTCRCCLGDGCYRILIFRRVTTLLHYYTTFLRLNHIVLYGISSTKYNTATTILQVKYIYSL